MKDPAEKSYEQPGSGHAVGIELDEMWRYLHAEKTNSGSGKSFVVIPVVSLNGNVAIATWELLQG